MYCIGCIRTFSLSPFALDVLLSILDSPFFTFGVTINLTGPFLTVVALALDIVHLTAIRFYFPLLSDIASHRLRRCMACSEQYPTRVRFFLRFP